MRLVGLTAIVMIAFAANPLLTRAALAGGHADSLGFALVRVVSGAVILMLLAGRAHGRAWLTAIRPLNIAALTVYLLAFSIAYLSLQAGAGALFLFGAVQITMFGGAAAGSEAIPLRRWVGAGLALGGLCWLLLPGAQGLPVGPSVLMALAGIGWGVYSLRGRAGGAPLDNTAASFAGAVPLVALAWLLVPVEGAGLDGSGLILAILSGAVSSGLGYTLWYRILPDLGATRAALAQLTVPVIAILGGSLFLGEVPSLRVFLSCALVIGGVAFGLVPARRR